jgi:hypothetical protein
MTSIVLTQPHTHAGKPFKAGERLDVESGIADWLLSNGIARHDRQPAPQPEGDSAPIEAKPTPTPHKESKS